MTHSVTDSNFKIGKQKGSIRETISFLSPCTYIDPTPLKCYHACAFYQGFTWGKALLFSAVFLSVFSLSVLFLPLSGRTAGHFRHKIRQQLFLFDQHQKPASLRLRATSVATAPGLTFYQGSGTAPRYKPGTSQDRDTE